MITRLYADNYKTLVNFDLLLGPMNLLLGANGAGKSTVLEVIRLIRDFVCTGSEAVKLFPTRSLCRWDTRKTQTFEIDLRGKEGKYTYRLEIEHDAERDQCRVRGERLTHNQQPIYVSGDNGGCLYNGGVAGAKFMLDKNRSGIGIIHDDTNKLFTQFKKRLKMAWSLHISPDKMVAESKTEDVFPGRDMSNFAAWYRHLVLDQPTRIFELTEVLKNEVLDGFRSLRLKTVGEKSRMLWAEFAVQTNDDAVEKVAEYRFGELSDGQRTLIALYALAICAVDQENTICLDHPESHLALPEIQPWLMRLSDATDEGRCQAIIATHHPELINLLAAHAGYWLERQSGGPTRVKKIGEQDGADLPLSELIARGWLHG
jgi:predicted ATPase